ncbi:zinc finger C2H2 protein [Iris pallida]|uniref:Zinc finger C2H2 protein n=1 Tax=Iris pallida TaxID=29817 RepID=A0AAX6EP51_IRIPA|nr:zinc finger C2H2 protein [Iris pallida]
MGGKCPHRKVKKRRLSHKSARRTKFELKDILFPLFFSCQFCLIDSFFLLLIDLFNPNFFGDHVTMRSIAS